MSSQNLTCIAHSSLSIPLTTAAAAATATNTTSHLMI
jgi:hypothetical protein